MDIFYQVIRHLELFCRIVELILPHGCQPCHSLVHLPHMADCLHNVASPRLPFCPNHGGPLADAPQRLAQILRAAHERNLEFRLVYMVHVIRR